MHSPRLRPRLQQGFSLLETVVVLGLLALVALAVIPNLDIQQGAGDDVQAQTTLEAALDSQVRLSASTGAFVDPAVDPEAVARTNPELTFLPADTASSDPLSVSVQVEDRVVLLTALGREGSCWALRRDYAALEGSPTALYGLFEPGTGGCTAERFASFLDASTLAAVAAEPDLGGSWQRPYSLS